MYRETSDPITVWVHFSLIKSGGRHMWGVCGGGRGGRGGGLVVGERERDPQLQAQLHHNINPEPF